MTELSRGAREDARVYLVGGATAVLYGWRATTLDVDLKLIPECDDILKAIPQLKERLHMNVELAAPLDFIPVVDSWQDRSPFVVRHGRVAYHHFDLDAQALAKIERDHSQDRGDVAAMFARGLVTSETLSAYYAAIEPQLYRYPALDPPSFKVRVERTIEEHRR